MYRELGSTPTTIDPYLNPAYWNERFIGDGTAQPWPELGDAGPKDLIVGGVALDLYAKQGASRLALSRLHLGDTFDASSYDPGTILLTLSEQLGRVSEAEGVMPMAEFQDVLKPDRLTGIVDGEQTLEGHGYEYTARPFLNVIVGRKARRVLLIPDAVVGDAPDLSNQEYGQAIYRNMERGFKTFTVGDVYNFGNNDCLHDQTLSRVTEAIVCMDGPRGRGIASLRALLAKKLGGSSSSATNPATS